MQCTLHDAYTSNPRFMPTAAQENEYISLIKPRTFIHLFRVQRDETIECEGDENK